MRVATSSCRADVPELKQSLNREWPAARCCVFSSARWSCQAQDFSPRRRKCSWQPRTRSVADCKGCLVLSRAVQGTCQQPLDSYVWIPRSKLAALGMPSTTCTSACGTVTINGVSYELDQINVADGSDACGVCHCDLAFLGLTAGSHLQNAR